MKAMIFLFAIFCSRGYAFTADVETLLKSDNVSDIKTVNLANFDFKERDQASGMTPLAYVLQYKKMNWANFLIKSKLGINTPDYLGRTPILIALQNNLSPDIVLALINSGANLKILDKSGRSIDYYLNRTSKDISELIQNELKKSSVPTVEDLNALKQILLAGDSEKLNTFTEKFHTIDFSFDQVNINEFLIDSNAIEKWSFENLIINGLNIFKNNFAAKVARAGKFNFFKEMMLYRFDFSTDLDGKSILEILLEKEASDEIIKIAIDRTSNLKKLNLNNENYAAIALRFKRYEIVKLLIAKNVLIDKVDEIGIAIQSNDRDLIKNVIISSNVNLTSRTTSGDDLGKMLAKNVPDLVIPLISQYKNSSYDLSTIKQDVPELNKASNTGIEDLEKALSNLPNLNPGGELEERPFETGIKTSKDLEKIDSEVNSLSFSLIGERKFDAMVESYVSDHLLELREKYEMTFDTSNSETYQKLRDLNSQIEKETSDIKELLKNKEDQFKNYSKTKEEASSIDLKKDESSVVGSVTEIVNTRKSLLALFHEKKQLLDELNEEKERAEAYLNMFKKGNAKVLKEIESKRNEIGSLKSNKQIDLDAFSKSLEDRFKADQDKLNFADSLYSESLKKISIATNENQQISKKIEIDNQNLIKQRQLENDPNAPAHIPNGHNPANCIYVKEAKRLSDEINVLSNQINTNQKKINDEQPILKKYKDEADYFRNLVSQQKEANQKEIKQYSNQLDKKYFDLKNLLERQLSNLEISKNLELSEFTGKIEEVNNTIAQNFSEPQNFEYVWAQLQSNLINLNNSNAIITAYSNLNNSEMKSTPIGSEVLKILEDLFFKTQTFEQKAIILRMQSSKIDQVDTIARDLKNNDKKIEELKDHLDELNNEKEKLKTDLAAFSNDSQIQEIMEQEELKYLEQFGIKRGVYSEEHLAELKANIPVLKDLSFDKLATKSPILIASVSFNDIETDNEKLSTTNKYEVQQFPYILQKWHEKILVNYGQGDLFRDQKNADLFIRALEKKVSFQEVSDGKSQSLKVLTSFGDFYLSKNGLPYSAEDDDPYKFEFLSTGENRELIEQSLETIKQAFPKLTPESLKKNFDLHFLISLLKYADKINDVKKTKEIVVFVADMVSYVKVLNTPTTTVIAQSMGIVKCGANIYEQVSLSQNKTTYDQVKLFVSCVKSILLVSNFNFIKKLDRINPDKILVNYVKSIYGEDDTFLRRNIYFMLEKFIGIVTSKIENSLKELFENEINTAVGSIKFLRKFNSLDKRINLKIQEASIDTEAIALKFDNIETGVYFTNGEKIIDTCKMNRDVFLESMSNLNLIPSITSYENIKLTKTQSFYRVLGDTCLIVVR